MIAEAFNHAPDYGVPTAGVPRANVLRGPQNRALVEALSPVREPDPLDVQVAGDHYKKLKIQPIEYIHANNIPFAEGNAIKYLTRWRDKGGLKDLEKARHVIDLLIQLETRK